MINYLHRFFHPAALMFSTLAGLVLVSGCETDGPLLAPDSTAFTQPSDTAYLSFSLGTDQPAAKAATTDADWLITSRVVEPDEGADLKLKKLNGPGKRDDLKVKLTVPEDAVDEEVDITMGMFVNYLGNLVVAFKPSGLLFNQAVILKLTVGADLIHVPLEDIVASHLTHENLVVGAEIISIEGHSGDDDDDGDDDDGDGDDDDGDGDDDGDEGGSAYDYIVVKVKIHGFSRYSLSNGDGEDEGTDDWGGGF